MNILTEKINWLIVFVWTCQNTRHNTKLGEKLTHHFCSNTPCIPVPIPVPVTITQPIPGTPTIFYQSDYRCMS